VAGIDAPIALSTQSDTVEGQLCKKRIPLVAMFLPIRSGVFFGHISNDEALDEMTAKGEV
jgi:hypothetical protein